ncbi:MAG: Uma2 family endonuclease [Deltaproteobacteria bacterium]|nr:Uma2 family endonuclease [Deltaproteobacteria bacterium]
MKAGERAPATYEDLLKVPDHMIGEILDGELEVSPRPGARHAWNATVMTADLLHRFGGPPDSPGAPGGWWILFEPELHLEGDVAVPDLAAWRRERMPAIPDVAFFTLAPDWVCEILSRGRERAVRVKKMPLYARAGVGHAWLADPVAKVLEVLRLEGGRWLLLGAHAGGERVRAEPFDAVELDLGRWWLP